jgi:hypothetical protein
MRAGGRHSGLHVEGAHELLLKLERLEKKAQDKIIKKANSKAVRPIIRAAKSNSRSVSRTISKAVGVKHKYYKQSQTALAIVGARVAKSVRTEKTHVHFMTGRVSMRVHDPRHTSHLVERGTKPHTYTIRIRKKQEAVTIRHPGTKAQPWLKPAYETQKGAAARLFQEVVKQQVMATVRGPA